jgi:FkbM family methyltransferase
VPETTFISHAQNGEDVVLWRALGDVGLGRYVEVGANHPTELSITRAFYDRGWSGLTIDPVADYVAQHREQRPRDVQVQAAVTDADVDEVVLNEIAGTGLSTLDDGVAARHAADGREATRRAVPARRLDALLEEQGWQDADLHFLVVDVEGAEAQVIRSIDLARWRPWVLVIESTAPLATSQTHAEWEPAVLAAGYEFCLFDGLSRYYVAREHAERLRGRLSYPACPLDFYERADLVQAREEAAALSTARDAVLTQLLHWRRAALETWAVVERVDDPATAAEMDHLRRTVADLTHDLVATRATLSWRVTAPLRRASGLARRTR